MRSSVSTASVPCSSRRPVVVVGDHALRDVAVEFGIDVRQRDRSVVDRGAGLEREPPEAALRQRGVAGPAQRLAQRRGVGGERAVDLEVRLIAHGAVERRLQRAGVEAELQTRVPAGERRGKIRHARCSRRRFRLCQLKWPVAAKLLAIEGQASDSSTPSSVSVSSRAGSRIAMVPSLMRISENESTRSSWSASGCSARASVSTSGDQLVCPSRADRRRRCAA